MRSHLFFPFTPWLGVVIPFRIPSIYQIDRFKHYKHYTRISKKSKVSDRSHGRPEGSLFNSYYTEV